MCVNHDYMLFMSHPHAGPLNKTLVDFWRMVWQERTPTIVMVTNLKENNKIKCQQYWPESGSKSFGPFMVTMTDQQVFADFTIRLLQVEVSFKITLNCYVTVSVGSILPWNDSCCEK